MREEKIYSLLLSAKDMFKLYSVIGDTLKSKTDFVNYSSNNESCKNAFELLKNICLASFEDGEYKKTKIINDESSFNKELIESLITNKEIPIKDIFNCDVFYDSFENSFYINRNSIKLDYSGLIMLMIDLSILEVSLNRLYFNNHRLLNLVKPSSSIKIQPNVQLNPDLLDKLLELEQKLGNEAEEKAFAFEKKRLFSLGITMEPLHISKIDCKAGFDIASYVLLYFQVFSIHYRVPMLFNDLYIANGRSINALAENKSAYPHHVRTHFDGYPVVVRHSERQDAEILRQ